MSAASLKKAVGCGVGAKPCEMRLATRLAEDGGAPQRAVRLRMRKREEAESDVAPSNGLRKGVRSSCGDANDKQVSGVVIVDVV